MYQNLIGKEDFQKGEVDYARKRHGLWKPHMDIEVPPPLHTHTQTRPQKARSE